MYIHISITKSTFETFMFVIYNRSSLFGGTPSLALCSYNKHVHFLNLNFAHLSNNNNSLHIRTLRLIQHLIQVITLSRSRILVILASLQVCLMQKYSVHLFYIPIEVIMNKYYQCQVLEHTHVNNINNNSSNNNNNVTSTLTTSAANTYTLSIYLTATSTTTAATTTSPQH